METGRHPWVMCRECKMIIPPVALPPPLKQRWKLELCQRYEMMVVTATYRPSHEVIYSRVISASGLVASPAVTHWDMCCTPPGLRAVCYCPFESVSQWCHTGHLLVNNWLQQMMCFQKNRVTRTLHLLQNMVAGFILLSLIEVINGADITMMSDIWLWTRAVLFLYREF